MEQRRHQVDAGLNRARSGGPDAQRRIKRARHSIAREQEQLRPPEVARQRRRVVRGPVDLVGHRRAEDRARRHVIKPRLDRAENRDEARVRRCVIGRVDRPRVRQRDPEQLGMPGRVTHRAEAALRQPRNRAGPARPDRPEVRVDPRHELVDVERFPPLVHTGHPVRAPSAAVAVQANVRHHHDERPAGGRLRSPTARRPVRCAAARPV